MDPILTELFKQKPVRHVFDNGLTLLFMENHSAEVMSAQVWVKSGSLHEGDMLGSGLSHYLEHMLFKGTKRRTFKQITGDLQAVGANTNAYTTFDRTVYYVDGPSDSFETAVDVLGDMIFHSLIDEEETARERDVILREIDMGLDSPDHRVMQTLFKAAYNTYPYRYPIIGEKALYEKVTHEDLVAYYKSRYVPQNIVVSVAGALSFEKVKAEVEKAFGDASMTCMTNVHMPSELPQLGERTVRLDGEYNVTRGAMAFKIPGLGDPDSPGLDVLAHILGNGQSSLLWKVLRDEQQLVHYIDASSWNPGESGLFWISYTCDNGKRDAVESAVMEVIDGLKESGPTPEDLSKAVNSFTVSEINTRRAMSGIASRIALNEVVVGDLAYPQFYFEHLGKLDVSSVQKIASEYLCRNKLTAVTLEGETEKSDLNVISSGNDGLPDFEEVALSNGVRLLMQPMKGFPKIHFKTICLGGPLFEDPGLRGISSLMASLLTKDTANRSTYEVSAAIEQVGGYFTHFTGNNTFGLNLEVLSRDLPLAAELLSDALLRPVFNDNTFAIERDSHIAHIQESLDSIQYLAHTRLRKLFFGDHPYGTDYLGNLDSVSSMTVKSLEDYRNRMITASNVVLSVAGEFEPDELKAALESTLSALPSNDFDSSFTKFNGPDKHGYFDESVDREQTIVQQAFPDVGLKDEKFYVGELLDEYFSGMSSKLFENVRERQGLAYFVGSGRTVGIECGMFSFSAGTSLENYEKVLEAYEKEIAYVRDGDVKEEDFTPCRVRLKAAKKMSLQSLASRAMQSGLNAAYGLPINDWRNYSDKIDAISIEDLIEFTSGFTPDRALTSVVKSREEKCEEIV